MKLANNYSINKKIKSLCSKSAHDMALAKARFFNHQFLKTDFFLNEKSATPTITKQLKKLTSQQKCAVLTTNDQPT